MVRRRDAPPYAASTRNAARPSGCTCAQSFAGGAWGARDGTPRDGRRHDSADGGGACHVRSRRLRAYRAVCGGADAGSDLSAAEAVGAEFFLRALRRLRTPPAPMRESRGFPPGPFLFSSLYLCVRASAETTGAAEAG